MLLISAILAFALCGYSLMVSSFAGAGDDAPICKECHDDKQKAEYVHPPIEPGDKLQLI